MTNKLRKSLYLDRPTSHGGWGPESDNGSWNRKKPVYQQISDYLESMGLLDDNPRARLYEGRKIDFILLEAKQSADELATRLEKEAVDQGLELESSMSFKNLAIALLGTAGAGIGKLFFGAGYLIEAGLIVKGLINLTQSFNSLVAADDILESHLGYRPLSLRGAPTLSIDDIEEIGGATPEELLRVRRLIIAAVQYRVKGIIALLAGIPDELLGFTSAPVVVMLSSQPVDMLYIQTKKAFSGILDALPMLKKATERNDIIGKILGIMLKSNAYNLGKLYRVLQVAPPASGDEELEVIVNMDDLNKDLARKYKKPKKLYSPGISDDLDARKSEPISVEAEFVDDEGIMSETKLRRVIRNVILEKIYR